jgi:polyhydroxyalkanoate synthesis regulator phasin
MANVTLEEEERDTPCVQEGSPTIHNSTNDEDILNSFNILEIEETRLSEQKEHLKALLSQLETKAKDAFEKRRRKVDRLNSEVSDLRRRCEKFSKWLNSESALECSQAGLR